MGFEDVVVQRGTNMNCFEKLTPKNGEEEDESKWLYGELCKWLYCELFNYKRMVDARLKGD